MARYCTVEDQGRIGVNKAVLDGFSVADEREPSIDAASDLMDSFLGKQFTLPLLLWGSDLTECAAVLSVYALVSTEGFKPGENPEDTIIQKRRDQWMEWLKWVAENKVTPVVTPSPPASTGAGVAPGAPLVISNATRGWQDVTGGTPSGVAFAGRRP